MSESLPRWSMLSKRRVLWPVEGLTANAARCCSCGRCGVLPTGPQAMSSKNSGALSKLPYLGARFV